MAREDEDEDTSRPSRRDIWTSGWVGTPGIVAVSLIVIGVLNLTLHRWTTAILAFACALMLLFGAFVLDRPKSR